MGVPFYVLISLREIGLLNQVKNNLLTPAVRKLSKQQPLKAVIFFTKIF